MILSFLLNPTKLCNNASPFWRKNVNTILAPLLSLHTPCYTVRDGYQIPLFFTLHTVTIP